MIRSPSALKALEGRAGLAAISEPVTLLVAE